MTSKYKQEDIANHVKLFNKWINVEPMPLDTPMEELYKSGKPHILDYNQHRKRVVIWTGPAWEPWNKEKVDEGMAGSETWAAYLSREFVKKGYRCTVYNDLLTEDKTKSLFDPVIVDGKSYGSVIYRDHTQMMKDLEYDVIHYFIASRSLEPLRPNVHSCMNFVMIHDIWLSGDKSYDIMSWKVHKYAYLSDWHRDFLKQHHSMPENKMFLTSNGIDQTLYSDVDKVQKRNQTVYSSSPDRGLYELLQVWPKIRAAVPDMKLIVAYGFYNWETSAKKRGDTKMLEVIDRIKGAMKQDGVEYVGRVSKQELARYQMESKVWLNPTWFSESFCITGVENGFCKNALLSSDYAGLKTTVGSAGILIPGQSNSPEYLNRFTEESIKLLTDEEYRLFWARKAYEKMLVYTWEYAADTWIKQFGG